MASAVPVMASIHRAERVILGAAVQSSRATTADALARVPTLKATAGSGRGTAVASSANTAPPVTR